MCLLLQFYATITKSVVNVVWLLWGAGKEKTVLESSDLSLHLLHRSVGDEPPCYTSDDLLEEEKLLLGEEKQLLEEEKLLHRKTEQ